MASKQDEVGLALGAYGGLSGGISIPLLVSVIDGGSTGGLLMTGLHLGSVVFVDLLVGYARHTKAEAGSIALGGGVGLELGFTQNFAITLGVEAGKALSSEGFFLTGFVGPTLRFPAAGEKKQAFFSRDEEGQTNSN
ncbi:MAG: hypothetical protein HYV07_07690 [Deltaproteobacteria bacterium]|nr:hypothetical protein [Deltaproteobacteria bacterium]